MSKKTIAVHDGIFHCDELVAIALWILANPGVVCEVVRTRKPEVIEAADLVFDVGGKYDGVKYFDHHQANVPVHAGTIIKYAAAGMAWEAVQGQIVTQYYRDGIATDPNVTKNFIKRVTENLILGVDACDNGQLSNTGAIHQFTLSEIVKVMNQPNAYSPKQDEVFNNLIEVTKAWLDKYLSNEAKAVIDTETVIAAAGCAIDGVMMLPEFIPVWKEIVLKYNLPVKVALVGAGNDEWSITSALKESGSMTPLCPAPAELRGCQLADGKTLGGCPIVFIHKAGFTGKVKANSIEDALAAAKAWVNG